MKVQSLSASAARSLVLKTTIALCASFWLVPLSAFAQADPCTPVAYLFRHAEEGAPATNIDQNTLLPAGNQHAALYAGMIQRMQSKLGYCPLLDVFAMARKNAPNAASFPNGLGTTNPYFTAKPLANTVTSTNPITSTNPNVTEEIGVQQTDYILYEYLPYESTRDDLREIIKDAVESSHSVAIFWSSQGMNEVAEVLGDPIPAYAHNSVPALPKDYKAPRNSVFVFSNYNPSELAEPGAKVFGRFDTISISSTDRLKATTGRFIQCFDYIPGANLDLDFSLPESATKYYCKFNENLSDYKPPIPPAQLSRLKGAICDANNLKPYGDPAVYIGVGVGDSNQCF